MYRSIVCAAVAAAAITMAMPAQAMHGQRWTQFKSRRPTSNRCNIAIAIGATIVIGAVTVAG